MSYCYIEAPKYTSIPPGQPSIFLAGGITGVEDWQATAIKELGRIGDITICNPRRKEFNMSDSSSQAAIQIQWEHYHLEMVEQVLFWFSSETIQPIVLFELGARLRENKHRPPNRQQEIFIGCHPNYRRNFDVFHQARLDGYKYSISNSLSDLLTAVRMYNQVPLYGLLGEDTKQRCLRRI